MVERQVSRREKISTDNTVLEAIGMAIERLEEHEDFEEIWSVDATNYGDRWEVKVVGETITDE